MKTLIETNHFSADIDEQFIGIDITFSLYFKILNIQILNLVIRFY